MMLYNINTLLNSSGSLLSAKQAAITQIGDLEMQRVSVGSEGTFLKENTQIRDALLKDIRSEYIVSNAKLSKE